MLRRQLRSRYDIEEEVGWGATATVYRARERRYGRTVALKVLHPELVARAATRFVREIRITASLQHPNILPLLDSGTVDGRPFLVTPFVRGRSLRDRLEAEGPLSMGVALRIVADVAGALAAAHDRGIVHLDIKPANILLFGGHAVVTDFGIARACCDDTRADPTLMLAGTPEYMSPEQILGKPDLDGRSDLYSLGCVLFEMLEGDPPFRGRTGAGGAGVLARHLNARRPRLSGVRRGRAGLQAVVERALARNPADRFASAPDLVEALARAVRPSAERVPAASSTRRRWWGAVVGAAAVLAGMVVGEHPAAGEGGGGMSPPPAVVADEVNESGGPLPGSLESKMEGRTEHC